MTDLDNTQILTNDESLLQNSSTIESEASLKIISGTDLNIYQIGKETIIGRANPSDLIISAPSLSKQHAKITVNNGQYFITDLGSSNKTFHNKIQLQPNVCYAIHDGDEIKLGDIVCVFQEQKPTKNNVVSESNVDVIPSTQTISDSYDDQEPTQPMKIWNGNPSSANGLTRTSLKSSDDEGIKQNGLNDSVSNKSSSFIPSNAAASNNDNDDDGLVIGATTLPATVPLVMEPTQIDNDDQIEILSSSRTEKITKEDDNEKVTIETTTTTEIEIDKTQAYTLKPTDEEQPSNEQLEGETQAYELEPEKVVTDVVETKREEVREVIVDGEKFIEKIVTTTTTTTTTTTADENENVPMETQAYDLETNEEETTTTVLIDNERRPVETQAYDIEPAYEETTTTTTTRTVVETIVPPTDTLAYDLQPTNEDIVDSSAAVEDKSTPTETALNDLASTKDNAPATEAVVENVNPPVDQQSTDEQNNLDTIEPAVCADTQQYNLDEQIEDSSPRPASETFETVPMSTLVEQIQTAENAPDETPIKQQVEVTINQNLVEASTENEKMDTNQTEVPSAAETVEPTPIAEEKETTEKKDDESVPTTTTDATPAPEPEKPEAQVESAPIEEEAKADTSISAAAAEPEQKMDESLASSTTEDVQPATLDTTDKEQEEGEGEEAGAEEEEEEEGAEEPGVTSGRGQRGVPRRAARRARGRRGGAAARARVVSTRLHAGRRNAVAAITVEPETINTTLEETVNTEAEESPKKRTKAATTPKPTDTQPITPAPTEEKSSPTQANASSNIRVSARIKARASSGRNRQFPYTDDYVDLDDLEKHSKASTTPTTPTPAAATATTSTTTPTTGGRRSGRGGRSASASQKRISLRQQPIDATESPDEKTKKQKTNTDVYEQMDTGGENEEPALSTRTIGRKRKSTTPVATTTTKRTRSATPQAPPPPPPPPAPAPQPTSTTSTRRKQTPTKEPSPPPAPVTPKRGRKSTKATTPAEKSAEKQSQPEDRPVRIALSSHLNFDQSHLDALRKLGFEIMDESCHVDALVVDRIRRTKKFFMCLARGAHILSPAWIDIMVKENRYIPYEKYYLEDTNAEARYGFQLRESVRLAKQRPIFENYKIFCTKDTSPPYDDLKDIIEAAGGKFIDKINLNKPGKDLVCIVAQAHKHEYEDLCKKGVPIVSEEFALSGISKQKLDFEAFSLFQNIGTAVKSTGNK